MSKHKLIPLMATAFVLLGTATVGLSKFGPALVHAQTSAIQAQQTVPESKEAVETQKKESAETAEPVTEQTQEKNLPGTGHQDADGVNTNHQFEGVE